MNPTNGRVAVVTGSGRGIGKRIATRLSQDGTHAVLADRDIDSLRVLALDTAREGHTASVPYVDLPEPDSVVGLAGHIQEEFGRVDVLVNNSGVRGPSAPVWGLDETARSAALDGNLSDFRICKALIPFMISQDSGNIVLVGSITWKRSLLHRSIYAASRMGLLGFCRTLALGVAEYGLRVNLVSAGFVQGQHIGSAADQLATARGTSADEDLNAMTDLSSLKRLVSEDEVAEAVLFLSGARSSGITGRDLNVAAGVVMY